MSQQPPPKATIHFGCLGCLLELLSAIFVIYVLFNTDKVIAFLDRIFNP